MNGYKEAIKYLYSLQKYGIKFGLSSTQNLLNRFKIPYLSQNYIHIAGTNGKGSVANIIASILKEAGYKTGLYTSPHLVRFTERIQIDFKEIPKERVTALVKELRENISLDQPPTFFEAVTAIALTYFFREKADISVIEVGMGGRLDATNIITPLISVITNISYDHQQFLGNTLTDIAYEKAGIIKEGVPVVTGIKNRSVMDLIKKVCKAKNSKLFVIDKDFSYRVKNNRLTYLGISETIDDLDLSLLGDHQFLNTSIALAVIELLVSMGWEIEKDHIRQGLKKVKWPGRLHVISEKPFVILDGAHNPDAVEALRNTITKRFSYDKAILIIGIMKDKEIGAMLKSLFEFADHIIFSSPEYERAADPEFLLKISDGFKGKKEAIRPLSKAVERALTLATKRDLILICGSLFTVGEALLYLKPDEYSPEF